MTSNFIIISLQFNCNASDARVNAKPCFISILCLVQGHNSNFIACEDNPIRIMLTNIFFLFKSLLRSPEVVQFLQKQQQLLNQQVLEQRQQQFPGTSV